MRWIKFIEHTFLNFYAILEFIMIFNKKCYSNFMPINFQDKMSVA